jgi:hypothetical protein
LSTPQDIHTGATPTFAGGVFSGSSSGDLLRITQTGAGNALVVEDDTNPDSTPFVVSASGQVGIGTSSVTATVNLQIENPTSNAFQILRSGAANGVLRFERANTSTTSPTIVASGNIIGEVNFRGYDGASYVSGSAIRSLVDSTPGSGSMPANLIFLTAPSSSTTLTERMRIDSSGQVGIGATPQAGRNFTVGKAITGATTSIGAVVSGAIQSDVTGAVQVYRAAVNTAAASFTLASLTSFYVAGVATPGSGSTITNQYGFFVDSSLTGATNNFAFYGDIAAATGRYNLYMNGTAANFLAGRLGVGATLTSGVMAQVTNTTAGDKALVVKGAASQSGNLFEIQNSAGTALAVVDSSGQVGIGTTPSAGDTLRVAKNITGAVSAFPVVNVGTIQSDVTTTVQMFRSGPSTQAASFTLTTLTHYQATFGTLGASSAITNQYGFHASSALTGATNNYAFYGDIAAASNRWNLYMNGTARNYLAGGLEVVAGTTGMTTGFTHVPAAAGAPTGAPTNPTGNTPLYYDTTNNKLYVYNGAWKSVSLT